MDTAYKVLNQQQFSKGDNHIVPIRLEDRYSILQWRNEQLFHLRQPRPLTEDDQDVYFNTVVASLFVQKQPDQILFSYLQGDTCVGYGGLVHINWVDRNAELSFITDTAIQNEAYAFHMTTFLSLIEEAAFNEIGLHKMFTFAYDVRPYIYPILEANGFHKEAVLKEHCLFDGDFKDVIIHTKYNTMDKL